MYLIKKKQYIVKTSLGRLINIFYKPYAGLCAGGQNANGTWTLPEVILKNALPGFSVCLDGSDNLHMLCQDEKSNLLYMSCKNDSWSTQPVSGNISREVRDKYPQICILSGDIYFFYVIEALGKRTLFCQKYGSGGLSAPKAVDYVGRLSKAYMVLNEADKYLHVFYMKPGEKRGTPGYRVLEAGREDWSGFTALNDRSDISGEQLLSVSYDGHSNLHICMQRGDEHKFELVHLKTRQGGNDRSEAVLASSPYPFMDSSILSLKDRLVVYWTREDRIFYCVSTDNGNTWSKPEKYNFSENEIIHWVRFLTNYADDGMNTVCADIPANISEGFRPAFINDLCNRKEAPAEMEQNESIMLSKLNAVSSSVGEILKRLQSMDERLDKLEVLLQQARARLDKAAEAAEHTDVDPSGSRAASRTGKDGIKSNQPIITGTGFSQITYEYLKNMDKR